MTVVLSTERLSKALDYSFSNPALLHQALTHRSHVAINNERLEFIGDGVLNATVARVLYLRFPQLKEGELSRLRASLVCQEALADVARGLQLGDYLYLGEGELKSGGHRRPSILADALEAILGAIWLDGGFAAAETAIERLLAGRICEIDPTQALKDAKTGLQEWLQARRQELPEYSVLRQEGESPNQVFEVSCNVNVLQVAARAEGPSRRIAEQGAAAQVLAQLKERYPGKRFEI